MKNIPICLLLALCFMDAFSQEGLGLNPPGMEWRQIQTPAGRIIFPQGLDSLAVRAAGIVNYQRAHDSTILGAQVTKPVPHIIQNQSVLPAGFSTPAPWRNEYYLTPPANMFLGPVSWSDAMEIHEYRHAQQFSIANQGLTLPYKIVMGQMGWLLNSLITQPLWFREGDAVVAETIFTTGGRGRLPSFHMEYRAMRLKGYHYSYEKAHYTSLRDFVPNPYRIGYYMVSKGRRDFGNDLWNHVLLDTYRKKGFLFPFSRSLKKFTGSGTRAFYNETVRELDSLWSIDDESLELTSSTEVCDPQTKKYTNYRLPQFADENTLVVLKSSLDIIPTYYLLDQSGKEKKLFSPGRYSDDHLTLVAENGKIVWAESGFHERYLNKDYSIIKIHNLRTGQTRKLTSRTRYFSPAISHDGKRVFATETDHQNNYFFLILDAENGGVLKRSANPNGVFLSHPRWMDDNVNVVCIALSEKGNAIVILNTESGSIDVVVGYTYDPISRPFPRRKNIFFSAGKTDINNIYVVNISDREVKQVTSVRFGAFEPVVSPDGKVLIFSEYTADGYRIQQMDISPPAWEPITDRDDVNDFFLSTITNSEEKDITSTDYSGSAYPVKRFNTFTNGLFNFYGWLVLPNIPEYGIELYTQNMMSTLRGTVGALYNANENRFHYYARATYAALYPIVELEYHHGNRHTDLIFSRDEEAEPFSQPWRENFFSAGVRLPFRLTQGTHNTNLSLEGRFGHYRVDFLDTADTHVATEFQDFNAWHGAFTLSRLKMRAVQQFQPAWGQTLDVDYRNGIGVAASRLHANAQLFFPGIARTHSLNLRGAYKEESVVDAYRFTDDFVMPRGHRPFPFEEVVLASVNYEFPIFYPDVSAGPVAFIQRVRANFFYDHAIGNLNDREITMRTPGSEVFADLRLFRLFQMTLCFRCSFVELEAAAIYPQTTPFQFLVTRFELVN